MHHLTKKSAVEKYSPLFSEGVSRESLMLAISEDPKNFSADDINEIVSAIIGDPESNRPPVKSEEKPKQRQPNEVIDLSKFNYKDDKGEFKGDQFKSYEEEVLKLPLTKQFDFEAYKASPVKVERYPGLPQSPVDIVGIKLDLDRPLFTTRIEARHALEMNRQLANTNRYYLLKK